MTKKEIINEISVLEGFCQIAAESFIKYSNGEMDYYEGKSNAYKEMYKELHELNAKINI